MPAENGEHSTKVMNASQDLRQLATRWELKFARQKFLITTIQPIIIPHLIADTSNPIIIQRKSVPFLTEQDFII